LSYFFLFPSSVPNILICNTKNSSHLLHTRWID
jgi:hypothetical protein